MELNRGLLVCLASLLRKTEPRLNSAFSTRTCYLEMRSFLIWKIISSNKSFSPAFEMYYDMRWKSLRITYSLQLPKKLGSGDFNISSNSRFVTFQHHTHCSSLRIFTVIHSFEVLFIFLLSSSLTLPRCPFTRSSLWSIVMPILCITFIFFYNFLLYTICNAIYFVKKLKTTNLHLNRTI